METKLAQVPITNKHDDGHYAFFVCLFVNILSLCLSGHFCILSHLLQLSSHVSLGCELPLNEEMCICFLLHQYYQFEPCARALGVMYSIAKTLIYIHNSLNFRFISASHWTVIQILIRRAKLNQRVT